MNRSSMGWFAVVAILAAAATGQGAERFRFREGKHGGGELRYIGDLPVLTLEGGPAEIGEQMGVLTQEALKDAQKMFDDYVDRMGMRPLWPVVSKTSVLLAANFPRDYLAEVDGLVKGSGLDRGLIIAGHVLPDMIKLRGCSDLVVEPARSASGGLLFGRNTDLPPVERLSEYSLVTIYRPRGKRAFLSINFPGMVGLGAGMNDAGLCLASNEILSSADGAPRFDPAGGPLALNSRRLLEECRDLDEAEKLIRSMKWCTAVLLCMADNRQGRVFEITPKTVHARAANRGLCGATNHFRTDGLTTTKECWRFERLARLEGGEKMGVAEVAQALDEVNQEAMTVQTAVFEPATLTAHIALGAGPATKLKRTTLKLGDLFQGK